MTQSRQVASLTNGDVSLVLSTRKLARGKAEWKLKPGRVPQWRLELDVIIPEMREGAKISGRIARTNWSYSLVFRNVAIRKTGNHGGIHKNPDGQLFSVPHKHTWSETYATGVAYIPDDIDFGDLNAAFIQFMNECKVSFEGTYQQFDTNHLS